MKKTKVRLKLSKTSIAKISASKAQSIFGGTDPISFTRESALATQCGDLKCY